MDISTNTGIPLIGNLIGLFWLLALMYILCQFGQQLTDQFFHFEHTIYECQWYTFPVNTQKRYFTMIMSASQKPVELKGYGNVRCSFETFKNVILIRKFGRKIAYSCVCTKSFLNFQIVNGSFSYFTMLLKIVR